MSWLSEALRRNKEYLPLVGAGVGAIFGQPWLGGAAGAAAGSLFNETPKMSEYTPSAWEQDYYNYLKDIREGTSPLLNVENRYKLLKEKMQPEYKRLQKEYDIYSARRGIQGGPQQAFQQGMAEDQLTRLMQIRNELEESKRQLQLSAAQSMGQLGSTRSAAESQMAMANFQAALQQHQQLQDALGQLVGTAGSMAYEQYFPQQSYEDLYYQLLRNQPLTVFKPQMGTSYRMPSPTYKAEYP